MPSLSPAGSTRDLRALVTDAVSRRRQRVHFAPSEYAVLTRREMKADSAMRASGDWRADTFDSVLQLDVASCRRRAMELLCIPLCALLAEADKNGSGASSSAMRAAPSTTDVTVPAGAGFLSRLFTGSGDSAAASDFSQRSPFNTVANESARGAVCALLLSSRDLLQSRLISSCKVCAAAQTSIRCLRVTLNRVRSFYRIFNVSASFHA